MEKQLSFELKVLSSGKYGQPSLNKHLSGKKEQEPKRENKKKKNKKKKGEKREERERKDERENEEKINNKRKSENKKESKSERKQAVKELLPRLQKETKLGLGFLSLKDNVQEKTTSEINILNESFLEEQSPKKDMFFENQIELIGVKTVAEMLGLAPKTIHNWVSLRKIPYLKCGHKVMFRPKSLKAWLNRKEIKSWL